MGKGIIRVSKPDVKSITHMLVRDKKDQSTKKSLETIDSLEWNESDGITFILTATASWQTHTESHGLAFQCCML